VSVAAGAIDHGACNSAAMSDHSQNVTPNGRIFAATVIDDDDAAFGNAVNEISDRAGRLAGGSVQQREGTAGGSERVIERLDAETLPCNPEAV
jgi:hypothetical protein